MFANFRLQGGGARLQVQDTTKVAGNDSSSAVELLQFDDGFYDSRNSKFTTGGFASADIETLLTSGLPTG